MRRAKRGPVAKQQPKNRTLDDMQRFYRTLDLAGLWEEFYASIGSSGRPLYNTVRQFAKAKAVNEKQLEFLLWLFGPEGADPQADLLYPFAKPLDFEKKRASGGWFTDEALKAHSREIAREISALDALRMAGNGITINSLVRMENLARRLDEDFGGRFFVEGLSMKQNLERASEYVSLHARLLNMIAQAQDIYAKSHGINFADMSGFERLLAAQAMTLAASSNARESRAFQAIHDITEMTLEKAAKHGFELPSEITNKIVTIEGKKPPKSNVM